MKFYGCRNEEAGVVVTILQFVPHFDFSAKQFG